MKYDDLRLLLKHEDESLNAVAELMRASLAVLGYVRQTGDLPELVAPCLEAAIAQCEQAAQLTRRASDDLVGIVRDMQTLAELRAAHDERRMR